MQCLDHPILNRKNGVDLNLKNGIHVHYPDIVCDRRKLIEMRREALQICKFFVGACNDPEDIFDEAVYRVIMFSFHHRYKKRRRGSAPGIFGMYGSRKDSLIFVKELPFPFRNQAKQKL